MKQLSLLNALPLLLLAACSRTLSVTPTPALQANLAQRCPDLPLPPDPLLDPARALWEEALASAYGDCADRHIRTVQAWPKEAVE